MSSEAGMLVGNRTPFICLICSSRYLALACSLAIGSRMSCAQGIGIGLISVGPTWGTGVDSATGTLIPVVLGNVFMYNAWEGIVWYEVVSGRYSVIPGLGWSMAHALSAKEFSSSLALAVTAIHLSNTFTIVSVMSVNTVALSPIIGRELGDTALSTYTLSFV